MAVVHDCALLSLIHCIRGNFSFFSQIESNVVVNKSFYLYGLIWDFIFTKSQYKWENGKYTKRFSINNIILCILFFILFSLSCMSRPSFFLVLKFLLNIAVLFSLHCIVFKGWQHYRQSRDQEIYVSTCFLILSNMMAMVRFSYFLCTYFKNSLGCNETAFPAI